MYHWVMKTQEIKKKILSTIKREDVVKAALFGSFAKGEEKRSDIDILIEYRKGAGKSLLDMVKLQFELEEILGRKVDLFTYDGIHSLIKDSILSHREVIYEKRK